MGASARSQGSFTTPASWQLSRPITSDRKPCCTNILCSCTVHVYILVPNTCRRPQVGYKNVQFETRLFYVARTGHKHSIYLKLPSQRRITDHLKNRSYQHPSMGSPGTRASSSQYRPRRTWSQQQQEEARQGLYHDHVKASQQNECTIMSRAFFFFWPL